MLGINIILLIGGFVVLGWGLVSLIRGLSGHDKDLHKIMWGIGGGALGVVLMFMSSTSIISFFQSLGQQIPLH